MTSWPTRSEEELPNVAYGKPLPASRSTAMSVSGSSPTSVAETSRPSVSAARNSVAPFATWLFVSK